ncbi:thioester domain-containing protein [Lactobacillus corticis]|uniref:thioester domain-containing protein n=1 Tax=Lactobacillus corticis TaxID=2201249 RepID=UPI001BB2D44D|nr:thioester domain-containing protein [Lactobacillus corticis]
MKRLSRLLASLVLLLAAAFSWGSIQSVKADSTSSTTYTAQKVYPNSSDLTKYYFTINGEVGYCADPTKQMPSEFGSSGYSLTTEQNANLAGVLENGYGYADTPDGLSDAEFAQVTQYAVWHVLGYDFSHSSFSTAIEEVYNDLISSSDASKTVNFYTPSDSYLQGIVTLSTTSSDDSSSSSSSESSSSSSSSEESSSSESTNSSSESTSSSSDSTNSSSESSSSSSSNADVSSASSDNSSSESSNSSSSSEESSSSESTNSSSESTSSSSDSTNSSSESSSSSSSNADVSSASSDNSSSESSSSSSSSEESSSSESSSSEESSSSSNKGSDQLAVIASSDNSGSGTSTTDVAAAADSSDEDSTLPQTGDHATLAASVAGVMLLALAAATYLWEKRRQANK